MQRQRSIITSPLTLGVVGDSGSGKTTLVRGVIRRLGRQGVTPICLDDYRRYERSEREQFQITNVDPAAYDLGVAAEHLRCLQRGEAIRKPIYDQRSGLFRGPETVIATGLVVVYGSLTLSLPGLDDFFTLSIYLDPVTELHQAWQQTGDLQTRGYSVARAEASLPARQRDAARFVHGQRQRADLVISFYGTLAALGVRIWFRHLPRWLSQPNALPPAIRLEPACFDADQQVRHLLDLRPDLSPISLDHLRKRFGFAEVSSAQDEGENRLLRTVQDLVAAGLLEARPPAD